MKINYSLIGNSLIIALWLVCVFLACFAAASKIDGLKTDYTALQTAHKTTLHRADSLQHVVNAQRHAAFKLSTHLQNYGVYFSFCAFAEYTRQYNLNTDLPAKPCSLTLEDIGHSDAPYVTEFDTLKTK